MSTRDPDPGLTGFEALERLAAAAAGAPDAGLIARIANELFSGGFPVLRESRRVLPLKPDVALSLKSRKMAVISCWLF